MVILFLLLGLVSGGLTVMLLQRHKETNGSTTSKFIDHKLSWPAKQILKEYNDLPVENRPFADIKSMLVALDVKHGVEAANAHYRSRYLQESYSWTTCEQCRSPYLYGKCGKFKDYTNLKKAVDDVAGELEKQRHALEVAKIQPDLDDIQTLTERLRQEKEIIQSVTKELT